MAEVDGVREYNRIRRYLSHIYLYGFFSREDFQQAGIGSVKDYDYGAKLIRSIFPETEQAALWQQGRKYLRIQREYAQSGENRMTDSYLLHTMDVEQELPELLTLLSCLAGGPKNLDELCKAVELRCRDEESSKYPTVRRRVLDLAAYGSVVKRGKLFSLRPDGLSRLSDRQLEQLYDYVCFAGGVTYPRVAGSFLRRTLKRELLRRGLRTADSLPFLLRHSVSHNVFDEEVVYQLLSAIRTQSEVELELDGRKTRAIPAALRADTRLGRWYLLSVEEGRPILRRVSAIRSVKALRPVEEVRWREAGEAAAAAFARTGCSGTLPQNGPVLVEAKLNFQTAPGIRAQFQRELRLGEIVEREDGAYYRALINDPLELFPFLRSFSPWLRILPGEHGLDRRLREDLLQMLGEEGDHETAE